MRNRDKQTVKQREIKGKQGQTNSQTERERNKRERETNK
jgi:hypothetical protein